MLTPENITKHELTGLNIIIVKSSNQKLVGKKGKIVDETKNTITISEGKSLKTLIKSTIVFQTTVNNKKLEIDGKSIIGNPEDRIKKH